MGLETANVHLGSRGARRSIERHLAQLSKGWLRDAAESMKDNVEKDFKYWHRHT